MYAKKSLGQHWLRSAAARTKIIRAAKVAAGETVLEIGPGRGFLTESLLISGAKVIAVEKDEVLVAFLGRRFADQVATGQLQLINADILEYEPPTAGYKLVANIPYYLTGQIFRHFLGATPPTGRQPTSITVLIQKEVAERIVAKNNKESLLSLGVKAYGQPRYVATVGRQSFLPVPNVDSAILHVSEISRERLTGVNETEFFALLKKGFSSKRKMLKNNIGLGGQARAEDLKLNDWLCLYQQKLAPSS